MSRNKETITLSIPPGTKEQLEEIARRLNIFWGKDPSISGLIVAIAQQQFEVGQPYRLDTTQVTAIQQAIKILIDLGNIGEAQTLLELLLERGNLETPLRQSLFQQISQPTEAWRRVLDQQIQNQQPFRLLYRDGQGQELEFTVRFAEIRFVEKRFYLEAWCDETDNSDDLPELAHNRCFRLDRIINVLPVNGVWGARLDYLKVHLHLLRGLVKAYEAKGEDIEDEVVGNVRQVVRRVSNVFWFIREVIRYGDDCIIVSPESVRDRLKQKLKTMCHQYDIEIQD